MDEPIQLSGLIISFLAIPARPVSDDSGDSPEFMHFPKQSGYSDPAGCGIRMLRAGWEKDVVPAGGESKLVPGRG